MFRRIFKAIYNHFKSDPPPKCEKHGCDMESWSPGNLPSGYLCPVCDREQGITKFVYGNMK